MAALAAGVGLAAIVALVGTTMTTIEDQGWGVPGDWIDDAACAGEDQSLFFPDRDTVVRARGRYPAKAICAGCPVRDACLDYCLTYEFPSYRHGIWGGLTPRERGRLTAREKAQVARRARKPRP